MFIFALSGFINGIFSLVFGTFVYFRNKKGRGNQLFCITNLAVMIWAVSYAMWQLYTYKGIALFWTRMLSLGATFIPIFILHWIIALVELEKKKKRILFFGYFLTFFFILFSFSPLYVKDVKPILDFPWWPQPGILYTSYIIFGYFGLIGYGFYLLLKAYRRASGIKKEQIKYTFLGTSIAVIGGATNFLLWYDVPVPPYGNFLVPFYPFVLGYAISRYRLMDIRIVLGRGAVYLFSFATIIALAFGLVFLNNHLPTPIPTSFAYIAVLIISIFLFQLIFKLYERLASKYFYYTFYSYQKVITDLGKKLTAVLELKKLTSLIADTLIDTMKLDKAGVLLRDPESKQYKIQKIIGFEEENGISLVRDNFLTLYLEKTKKPVVYEELSLAIRDAENKAERERLESLRDNMKRIEAKLCLPLIREDKIMGIIVLGSKISNEPYSQQDLELLTNLSNQAAVALENARLYAQIRDLSQNLQKKVDEQTKEIKKAYVIEKRAHQELKKLDEAKTQFIMATQHHLRTPLTSMIGYLDLIFGGSYGNVPPRLKKTLQKFQASTNRLIRIVNEFLDISQFQLGKQVVLLKPDTKIEPILEEIVEELKFEAETKGLYLKIERSKKEIPLIKADPEKLKVALFNIVDNAIKYTHKGGITIRLKAGGRKLKIIVKDTGIGIPKRELKTLFTRLFERGKKAKKVFATGRGIGLFITSQIIKAHHGKVWAESKGRNKGSVFYVELPMEK